MEKPNLDRTNLRKFGLTMAVAFLALTLVIFIRHRHNPLPTFAAASVFLILSFLTPAILRPAYVLWMKFAFALGWLNTRLILIAMFYLIFTPIGLAMKLCGADPLENKIDREKASYWKKREEKDAGTRSYERQF